MTMMGDWLGRLQGPRRFKRQVKVKVIIKNKFPVSGWQFYYGWAAFSHNVTAINHVTADTLLIINIQITRSTNLWDHCLHMETTLLIVKLGSWLLNIRHSIFYEMTKSNHSSITSSLQQFCDTWKRAGLVDTLETNCCWWWPWWLYIRWWPVCGRGLLC